MLLTYWQKKVKELIANNNCDIIIEAPRGSGKSTLAAQLLGSALEGKHGVLSANRELSNNMRELAAEELKSLATVNPNRVLAADLLLIGYNEDAFCGHTLDNLVIDDAEHIVRAVTDKIQLPKRVIYFVSPGWLHNPFSEQGAGKEVYEAYDNMFKLNTKRRALYVSVTEEDAFELKKVLRA